MPAPEPVVEQAPWMDVPDPSDDDGPPDLDPEPALSAPVMPEPEELDPFLASTPVPKPVEAPVADAPNPADTLVAEAARIFKGKVIS
jgi:hypothetical protein